MQLIRAPLIGEKAIPMLLSSAAICLVRPKTAEVSQGEPLLMMLPIVQTWAFAIVAVMPTMSARAKFFLII